MITVIVQFITNKDMVDTGNNWSLESFASSVRSLVTKLPLFTHVNRNNIVQTSSLVNISIVSKNK